MRMLLTMSGQVVVMARTKLVAMEMEKSEVGHGHDLDPGIMGKGNCQGGIRFLMTSVWDKLCWRCLRDIPVAMSSR